MLRRNFAIWLPSTPTEAPRTDGPELTHLYHTFQLMMEDVKEGRFSPAVVYDGDTPVEYASVPLTCYEGKGYRRETFESISTLLENYYASRDTITRIRQKSSDLRRIVQTALERSCKNTTCS